MTIFLDEACIAKLVTMQDALAALEEVFAELANGHVANVPRVRAPLTNGILRITAAVLNYRGYYGIKVSSTSVFGRNAGRLFCLYKEEGGQLCAIMQVFGLGALRTGAASGIATRHMARKDARVLGVIGCGRQARTQVEAITMVRPIEEVRAFSRNEERCELFCRDIASDRQVNANAVATAEAAVRDCDIVVTATTSTMPVLFGDWLRPGTHVNAIGANYEHRRELDLKAVQRANVVAADDLDQVRYESSDLAQAVEHGVLDWEEVASLGDIVAGRRPGRQSEQDITLFKSLGVAMEDVALSVRAYEKAVKLGLGQPLPDLAG
jgi:ornithine cyclodeaminase/alanine dehydrogenase-like protein (mu-crystallin family)